MKKDNALVVLVSTMFACFLIAAFFQWYMARLPVVSPQAERLFIAIVASTVWLLLVKTYQYLRRYG